jgi:hypothetical protein
MPFARRLNSLLFSRGEIVFDNPPPAAQNYVDAMKWMAREESYGRPAGTEAAEAGSELARHGPTAEELRGVPGDREAAAGAMERSNPQAAREGIHLAIPVSSLSPNSLDAEAQTCSQSWIENFDLFAGLYFGSRPAARPARSGSVRPSAIMASAG